MGLFSHKNNLKKRRLKVPSGRIGPRYYDGSTKTPSSSPFQNRPVPKKTTKQLFSWLINALVLTTIFAGVLFCLVVKPQPHMIITSNAYHPSDVYEAAAKAAFSANRNKTKLTLDERGIAAALKKQFPEIDAVKISLPIVSQIPSL